MSTVVVVPRSKSGGGVKGARYIVVDGPIGVGKTTLARLLADAFEARLVLEVVDENPFLKKFYERPRQYAFQTQLFFLLTRYRQQRELAQQDLFSQNTVVDYLFAKDQIFAQLNLDADELALYRQLFGLLDARLPKPDLVVYLQARADVLLSRLRKRDRDYERRIAPEYIGRVAEAYRDYFFYYDETPLLVVNSSDIDFVANSDEMADLIREIKGMGQGVQHYIPLGSK
jgi:deoxyadenosine/deoxycytidine kinase